MTIPVPPEARLLHLARSSRRLSIREAARRAEISENRWRQIEAGYQTVRAGVTVPAMAKAATLAGMARVVGISPDRLETEGLRPDAAEILRDGSAAPEATASAKVPSGQVITIELPGLTAIRIDTARRVIVIDGISGTPAREEALSPEWVVRDLRGGNLPVAFTAVREAGSTPTGICGRDEPSRRCCNNGGKMVATMRT